MNKILVTGNMGYVGPSVAKRLRRTYPDVTLIGLDMGYFAHCLTGVDIFPEHRLDLQYFADVRNVHPDILKDVYGIVHLAAISNDPMGNTYETVTSDVNYRASVNLARLAKEAGVKRFVFASSCSTYGFAEGEPRKEDSELNPLTAYARSKVDVERNLLPIASEDFVITCLRFATACGMSERLRLDLVLNDFVAGAVAAKKITILSDGTPWRPLIHVEDMARAMEWAINRHPSNGGAFLAINTGNDEWNYQVRDLAEAVAKVVSGVEVSINKHAEPDKRSYQVDFSLFKKLAPHHQPQTDLVEAIRSLRNGLETMDFRDNNFRDSHLIRLKVLSNLREKGMLNANLGWERVRE